MGSLAVWVAAVLGFTLGWAVGFNLGRNEPPETDEQRTERLWREGVREIGLNPDDLEGL